LAGDSAANKLAPVIEVKTLWLTNRSDVAFPESLLGSILAPALCSSPLPRSRKHDSAGDMADLRDSLLGNE